MSRTDTCLIYVPSAAQDAKNNAAKNSIFPAMMNVKYFQQAIQILQTYQKYHLYTIDLTSLLG